MPLFRLNVVAFGGNKLDLLFLTSARVGLTAERIADEPTAGDLFVYQADFKGLPADRFGQE